MNIEYEEPTALRGIQTTFRKYMPYQGAKGDWDLRISDLVKKPDGTDI